MSSMMNKKKINEVVVKKIAPVRLVKCYVCNKLFNTQPQFDLHLEQHQSKLSRTNVEEIQRKTQESFRSKRLPSAKTVSMKREESLKTEEDSHKQKSNGQQENMLQPKQKQEKPYKPLQQPQQRYIQGQQLQQEQQLEEALRESQILLEKIQFLTQIVPTSNEDNKAVVNIDQDNNEEYTIQNQYQLYLQLLSSCTSNPEILIMKTKFEDKTFENYQEQLKHLRNLSQFSINPESIAKIALITKNISKDVLQELRSKFGNIMAKQTSLKQQKQIIKSGQNVGEVAHCSICFSRIEVSSGFLHSQLGTIYHKECYDEQ